MNQNIKTTIISMLLFCCLAQWLPSIATEDCKSNLVGYTNVVCKRIACCGSVVDSIDMSINTTKLDDIGLKYVIKRKIIDIDGEETETIYFINGNDTIYIWEVKSIWGDSNSISINVGDFDILGDTLILYNFWAKAGDAPISPYGARIQRFRFSVGGNISFINGEVYIETMSDYYIYQNHDKEELGYHLGSQFVNQTPKTDEEKSIFKRYIEGVERCFNAHFVLNNEAGTLFKVVRARLSRHLNFYTGKWSETYNDNGFGFKK